MLAYFRKMQRQKAIATAQRNAKTLIADGYRFVPVARGFFDVIRPNETDAAYQVQLYTNRAFHKMTYKCSCKFFGEHAMCEHGEALILHITAQIPIVLCAEDAPEPDSAFHVVAGLDNAINERDTIRLYGLIWEPVITTNGRCLN